jgi:hypothetical protein
VSGPVAFLWALTWSRGRLELKEERGGVARDLKPSLGALTPSCLGSKARQVPQGWA